jgi:hypothetical protein
MVQFDNVQKLGRDNVDAVLTSFSAVSKGAQTAAVELAEFVKRSFDQGTSTLEKLVGVRTLDKALEIQTDFVRASYGSVVAQGAKLGELCTTTAREAYAPVEALVSSRQRGA